MRSVLTIGGFGVDDLLLADDMLTNGDVTRGSTREIAVGPLHFSMQQISLGFRLTALSEFLDPVEVEISSEINAYIRIASDRPIPPIPKRWMTSWLDLVRPG
jgi:hypothetical protein